MDAFKSLVITTIICIILCVIHAYTLNPIALLFAGIFGVVAFILWLIQLPEALNDLTKGKDGRTKD